MYIKIPCDQVSFELKKMGVHPTGIALMAPKAVVEPLRLVGVRAPGANIIKQEMLAMGAFDLVARIDGGLGRIAALEAWEGSA